MPPLEQQTGGLLALGSWLLALGRGSDHGHRAGPFVAYRADDIAVHFPTKAVWKIPERLAHSLPLAALAGIREEQLFALYLIGTDGFLSFHGHHPIDERLAQLFLHARMFLRVHQDDAVLVE